MILASALRLFEDARYDEATMANVARSAGIAKGTLYLYFPTKETLFLELLGDRLGAWFEDLERDLAAAENSGEGVDVPVVVARSLAKRQSMCRLLSILHSTLERNVDEDLVRQFKVRLAEQLAEGATSLQLFLPRLSPAEVHSLLLRTHALTIGLIQMANPVHSVKASYDSDPRLSGFKVDFELELRAGLRDWLAGWGASTAN